MIYKLHIIKLNKYIIIKKMRAYIYIIIDITNVCKVIRRSLKFWVTLFLVFELPIGL